MLNEDGRLLTINDLACNAIWPMNAFNNHDGIGISNSKCLTELLLLTEEEDKQESTLTVEEIAFVEFVTKYDAINFDFSYERGVEAICFNY